MLWGENFIFIPSLQDIKKNSMSRWTGALLEFIFEIDGAKRENGLLPLIPKLKNLKEWEN